MVRHVFLALAIIATTALWADPAVAGEETVPDVVGLNVDKARELMEEAGFEATVERVTGKPLGIVFSQEPSGLCTRDTAIPITLRIGAPTPKPGGSADGPPAGNIPGSNAPVSREPGVGRADDSVGAPPAGEAPPRGSGRRPGGHGPRQQHAEA